MSDQPKRTSVKKELGAQIDSLTKDFEQKNKISRNEGNTSDLDKNENLEAKKDEKEQIGAQFEKLKYLNSTQQIPSTPEKKEKYVSIYEKAEAIICNALKEIKRFMQSSYSIKDYADL